MRPLSMQLAMLMPALGAVLLILLCAVPLPGGTVSYTPNIAWLMTLVMVAHYAPAWPRGFAFALGLLQDVLFGTPLGAQALLSLLLVQLTAHQTALRPTQRFRLRWLEAAGVLILFHLLLWAIMELVTPHGASVNHLFRAGIINALWYPIFYGFVTRVFARLPDAK